MLDERTILWHPPRFQIIILVLSLIFASTALADTPSDNDIPTLAMRILGSNLFTKDITLELLCELSWLNFDAVNFAGYASTEEFGDLMSLCDSAGVYYAICPNEVMQYLKAWGDSTKYRYWFRNSDSTLTSAHCFAQCDADFDSIVQYTTAESLYYESDSISIRRTVVDILAYNTLGHDFLWFYEVYDEANAQQGWNALKNEAPWDDYIPNVYTQARDSTGDTLALAEVETSGIFSIQKYLAENNEENEVTFTMNFALLHSIDTTEYTGLPRNKGWTTMATQAICVRAMMEAEYQPPPEGGTISEPVDNSPDFIMFDYYPFRQVNPEAAMEDTIPAKMCDVDWLFLIDHFEEGIDSTVIPALEYDIPVYFFPQTFGLAGGPAMYTDGLLDYNSYRHRKPASQEFRMLCNLALLHQAKGIFPYNLTSYIAEPGNLASPGNHIMSSLLDMHNIPFDADYEEWVYTGRWPEDDTYDYDYIRPDSLPPWIDGYDPLYDVSNPPDTTGSLQKRFEIWYEWLFGSYAVLYNDLGGILADVKWIGPEMHDLWWCSGAYSDGADISYNFFISIPEDFITPVIKVFEDEEQESCYLFYVDRYCVSNDNPYEITFNPGDLPGHADCSTRLLDHSRRFIMEGTADSSSFPVTYTFLDTLDAGVGRLVQLVDLSGGLSADVRITSSNVIALQASDTLVRMEITVGDSVDFLADFYNMGINSRDNVSVILFDSTTSDSIGTGSINFDGLAFRPPCRICDCSTASFGWRPDSTDIGVHRLTAAAATWTGEPDSDDNSVDFVFLVNPRDYATEVRDDAWDMDEDTNSVHDWHTDDIETIAWNWSDTSWTDSVSGMFEGVINYDSIVFPFRGDISLAIPEDSTEYIDTDKYHMLSFGIVGINPEYPDRPKSCIMFFGWKDDENNWHDWQRLLKNTAYSVGNGWDQWRTIGPIDLNDIDSLWSTEDAVELWLRFQSGNPDSLENPDPIHIRIGWVRLEESAP